METNNTYTTNELSERNEVSDRYIQKIAKELGIAKTRGGYLFSDKDVLLIEREIDNRRGEKIEYIELD